MTSFTSKLSLSTATVLLAASVGFAGAAAASGGGDGGGGGGVSDAVIEAQHKALHDATEGKGFGPQAPRDLAQVEGSNTRAFGAAPAYTAMTLCDIHFHENAEHRGGEFTTYAGNGDGHGYGTGYKYDGSLASAELTPVDHKIGDSEHGDLEPGDTIEIHFVHSTAQATPAPTLGSCLSEAINNPQLRVEAVVGVLVNDPKAADFAKMAELKQVDGLWQAVNLPNDLGAPVVYAGSTTGPGFNEKGSPFEVTWSVRPKVVKIDINSVDRWLHGNVFEEDHAHGVRNLVDDPTLLSQITH